MQRAEEIGEIIAQTTQESLKMKLEKLLKFMLMEKVMNMNIY